MPPTLVAASVAWAVTVAPTAFARVASPWASVLSILALGAAFAGPIATRNHPRIGRHVGMSAFVGLAALTWIAAPHGIHPRWLDPIQGVCGAIAWGVFGLSWSERWARRAKPVPHDPETAILVARATLPPLSVFLVLLGVAAAVVFLALAWRIHDPSRALVAQVLALGGGVAFVSGSATVATSRGCRRSLGERRLTPAIARALVALLAVAVAGAVMTATR